jgi:6-phosphogluconolactonase
MGDGLVVLADAEAVARAGAATIENAANDAVRARGSATIALSGGRTPWRMLHLLAELDVPWSATTFFQVDERIAGHGDPDRNLTHIEAAFDGVPATVVAMNVEGDDLDAAAATYAASLPASIDLVHLGLGPDGHTASLVPSDPSLDVVDRTVALTEPYQGYRRMTLTIPCLRAARHRVFVVDGEAKRDALAQLLAGDPTIPASRLAAGASIIADVAAHGGV